MKLSVLIYEDNTLLRESVAAMIDTSAELKLEAAFEHVLNVEAELKAYNPDVVLMDIDMPGMTGIEAVQKIRRFNIQVPIIMLTVFDDNAHVFEALQSGASGYLLKKHISTKLFDAIQEVMEGGHRCRPALPEWCWLPCINRHPEIRTSSPPAKRKFLRHSAKATAISLLLPNSPSVLTLSERTLKKSTRNYTCIPKPRL